MFLFDAALFIASFHDVGMRSVAAMTHSCGERETVGAPANHFHMVK
jgi:hypothetical protein